LLRVMSATIVTGTLTAAVMWVAGWLISTVNDLPIRRDWNAPNFADVTRHYAWACVGIS